MNNMLVRARFGPAIPTSSFNFIVFYTILSCYHNNLTIPGCCVDHA